MARRMADRSRQTTPTGRDRAVRRVRRATWATGIATAGLATTFSVVAAHAFKGHSRGASSHSTKPAAAPRHTRAARRVTVPAPQHVPSIVAGGAPLQPPATPPESAPPPAPTPTPAPAPAPQPQTSGGS